LSKGYEVVHIDELEAFPVDDEGLTWRPVRRRFDIRAFGCNAYTAERAGQRVVEEHSEPEGHDELYLVVSGHAVFQLDGDDVDAPAGTLVHAQPGTRRGAIAQEPGTTIFAVGAKQGVVFEPSPWEESFAATGYAKLGEIEKSRETFRAAVEKHPDAWQGWFNWACIEALHGDREHALEHLEKAAALDPEAVRKYAADDTDFDAIRGDARFLRITGKA
jgi:quercetin dioxygenase-like cupin family protein